MADRIFAHINQSSGAPHAQMISAAAARGGPVGDRLLAMMVAAIVSVVVASAVLDYLSWAQR